MKVSQVKIRLDNSDGTYSEINKIMPHEIADHIACMIVGWKDDWTATTNTVEKFKEESEKFLGLIKKV